MYKLLIFFLASIAFSNLVNAESVFGKRAAPASHGLGDSLRYCTVGFGETKSEAKESFMRKIIDVKYQVEGVCESGYAAMVRTSGGSDYYACGWSCGASSKEAAFKRALEECRKFGYPNTCQYSDIWYDDGNGVAQRWRRDSDGEELRWSRN